MGSPAPALVHAGVLQHVLIISTTISFMPFVLQDLSQCETT
jgi:hypothetical protein